MRTVPVNHSAGPLLDGCVPARLISIVVSCIAIGRALTHLRPTAGTASTGPEIVRKLRRESDIDLDASVSGLSRRERLHVDDIPELDVPALDLPVGLVQLLDRDDLDARRV